jgi:hypothetical protein
MDEKRDSRDTAATNSDADRILGYAHRRYRRRQRIQRGSLAAMTMLIATAATFATINALPSSHSTSSVQVAGGQNGGSTTSSATSGASMTVTPNPVAPGGSLNVAGTAPDCPFPGDILVRNPFDPSTAVTISADADRRYSATFDVKPGTAPGIYEAAIRCGPPGFGNAEEYGPGGRATFTVTATTKASPTTMSTDSRTTNALQGVNWPAISYPINCPGSEPDVRHVEYATPANGVQVAVVQVSCRVGATTPPSALLVYEPAPTSAQPRLVQTLVNYDDGWLFDTAKAAATEVTATVAGYSSDSVVRATPDITTTLKWAWRSGSYDRVSPVPLHEPFCGAGTCTPTTATGSD